jgi:hypothetical protein
MPENTRPPMPVTDPLAAWTELGLRTLDLTFASAQNIELVTRSWQQWLAMMEALLTPPQVAPARNAFGVQPADRERAVAHAEAEAEREAPRARRQGPRKTTAKPAASKRRGRAG